MSNHAGILSAIFYSEKQKARLGLAVSPRVFASGQLMQTESEIKNRKQTGMAMAAVRHTEAQERFGIRKHKRIPKSVNPRTMAEKCRCGFKKPKVRIHMYDPPVRYVSGKIVIVGTREEKTLCVTLAPCLPLILQMQVRRRNKLKTYKAIEHELQKGRWSGCHLRKASSATSSMSSPQHYCVREASARKRIR